MNFIILNLVFVSFLSFSGLSFAQITESDKDNNPVIKMHLFDKPGKVKIPKPPRQKLFMFGKRGLAKADYDNMPLYVPDISKSIKMPEYKPDSEIHYTIKRFRLNERNKPRIDIK